MDNCLLVCKTQQNQPQVIVLGLGSRRRGENKQSAIKGIAVILLVGDEAGILALHLHRTREVLNQRLPEQSRETGWVRCVFYGGKRVEVNVEGEWRVDKEHVRQIATRGECETELRREKGVRCGNLASNVINGDATATERVLHAVRLGCRLVVQDSDCCVFELELVGGYGGVFHGRTRHGQLCVVVEKDGFDADPVLPDGRTLDSPLVCVKQPATERWDLITLHPNSYMSFTIMITTIINHQKAIFSSL